MFARPRGRHTDDPFFDRPIGGDVFSKNIKAMSDLADGYKRETAYYRDVLEQITGLGTLSNETYRNFVQELAAEAIEKGPNLRKPQETAPLTGTRGEGQ